MDEPEDPDNETTIAEQQPIARYNPPGWITTDQLETELWNAIMEDTSGSAKDETEDWNDEPGECFEEEDIYSSEAEQRQSTFNLLIGMKPLLGELLGGPTSKIDSCSNGFSPEVQAETSDPSKGQSGSIAGK
jgi:hypothetical protein